LNKKRNPTEGLSLSQLTELTGLTPELIRAWERRYGFPTPRRTEGGHRRYNPEEVEALHRAALLVRSGYRARDAVGQARHAGTEAQPSAAAIEQSAESLAWALVAGDPAHALALLRGTERALGFEQALEERVLPALRVVGDGWQSGRMSVAEEHAATGIVISWLGTVRSGLPPVPGPLQVLIATPAGEDHAVAVWALELLLSRRGIAALALGSNVPQESLARELAARNPRALVFALARPNSAELRRAAAGAAAQGVVAYAGGPGAVRLPASVRRLPPTLTAAADALRDNLREPDPDYS
jgi:MerR family transcriptional regulator, light-induced transcriptional regulator